MIRFPLRDSLRKHINFRRRIVSVTICIVLGLILVAIIIASKINYLSRELHNLRVKDGTHFSVVVKMHKDLEAERSRVEKLQQEKIEAERVAKQKERADKQEHYFDSLANYIYGYYGTWGMKFGVDDRRVIRKTVDRVFKNVRLLYNKGVMRHFAPTVRVCSLRLLGEYQAESDFTLDLVCPNYLKDSQGVFILESRLRKIEKENDNGFHRYYIVEGKKRTEVHHYICKKGRRAVAIEAKKFYRLYDDDGDSTKVSFAELKPSLIVCSKDWGGLQVNDCNLAWTFTELEKLGLWSPDGGRWALDYDVNILQRLLVDDKQVARGEVERDNGLWNKTLVAGLAKINGWEDIME